MIAEKTGVEYDLLFYFNSKCKTTASIRIRFNGMGAAIHAYECKTRKK